MVNPADQWLHDLDEWRKKGPKSDRGPRPSSPRVQQLAAASAKERRRGFAETYPGQIMYARTPGAFAQLLRPGLKKDFHAAYAPLIQAQQQAEARTGISEILLGRPF